MRFHILSVGNVIRWDWTASGGSEAYHIELAERLAAKGHVVTSYSPLPNTTPSGSVHRNVTWMEVSDADITQPGVWIIQRDAKIGYLFAVERPHQVLLLAAHDYDYDSFPDTKWTDRFDGILCESEIHAKYFQIQYGATNTLVTGAGFPMDRCGEVPMDQRNPKRIIYTSNPTRGLLTLLQIFKRAREEDSELELVVGYGWEYLDALIATEQAARMKLLKSKIMKMMDQPGVRWLGRLPSTFDVWCEYAKSGMFVYPTTFNEIFCNSVAEAQCFGAIPVVSPTFAIGETTRHGVMIFGDPVEDRLVRTRFVREVLGLAGNHKLQDEIRAAMIPDARARFGFHLTVNRVEKEASKLWSVRKARANRASSLDVQAVSA